MSQLFPLSLVGVTADVPFRQLLDNCKGLGRNAFTYKRFLLPITTQRFPERRHMSNQPESTDNHDDPSKDLGNIRPLPSPVNRETALLAAGNAKQWCYMIVTPPPSTSAGIRCVVDSRGVRTSPPMTARAHALTARIHRKK